MKSLVLLTLDKRRKKWYRDATRTDERRQRPGRSDPGGRAATSTPAAQAATHKPDRATGTSRTAGPHKPGGRAATTRTSSDAQAPRQRHDGRRRTSAAAKGRDYSHAATSGPPRHGRRHADLDNCTAPGLPRAGTNEAAEWRNAPTRGRPARETPPKGAAARNCPDSRAGTRSAGDSGQNKHLTRHAAQAAVFPDARTPGRRERPKTATEKERKKKP